MKNKTWTYQEITNNTIARMQGAAEIANKFNGQRAVQHGFALGYFLSWESLTMGWQTPGDSERIHRMADNIGAGI